MNNIKISILTIFILSSLIFSKEKDKIKTMNKDGIIYQINSSSKKSVIVRIGRPLLILSTNFLITPIYM